MGSHRPIVSLVDSPFLGERRFDGWRVALNEYRKFPYEIILPGHGLPGGVEIYDQMLDYGQSSVHRGKRDFTPKEIWMEFFRNILRNYSV
jgi:hypothetical protein